MIRWTLILFSAIHWVACVRPSNFKDSRYPVTALLNDSAWFGNIQAVKAREENSSFCSVNRFHLFIRTDLPYDTQKATGRTRTVTGCLSECLPTQRITFFNLPLAKGKYKLAKLDKCGIFEKDFPYFVLLLYGVGSGLYKSYRPRKKAPNWVRITKYDSTTKIIEGLFKLNLDGYYDLSMPDHTASTANFRQGSFRVNLSQ